MRPRIVGVGSQISHRHEFDFHLALLVEWPHRFAETDSLPAGVAAIAAWQKGVNHIRYGASRREIQNRKLRYRAVVATHVSPTRQDAHLIQKYLGVKS